MIHRAKLEADVANTNCSIIDDAVLPKRCPLAGKACELRLVRCPFQCGVKVLERNLEKHKKTCSHRDAGAPAGLASRGVCTPLSNVSGATTGVAASTTAAGRAPPTTEAARKQKGDDAGPADAQGSPAIGPSDAGRTVTCMRCHESLPFSLVPSHGPKCKGTSGSGTAQQGAATPVPAPQTPALGSLGSSLTTVASASPVFHAPASTRSRVGAMGGNKEVFSVAKIPSLSSSADPASSSTPQSLATRTSSPLSPTPLGPKAWHASARIGGVLTPGVSVPQSPPRSKNVRYWGTRQVTSWLRESMRPPRADIISKFHKGGIDGTALMELTDRYAVCTVQMLSATIDNCYGYPTQVLT